MIIIAAIMALVGYLVVLYQAHGRMESMLLWSLVYLIPVSLICMIPNFHIVMVLINILAFGLVGFMGPWKRKTIIVVDRHGRDPAKVKEDYTNLVGVAENEDVKVLDVTKFLSDPLPIKQYDSYTGQQELWKDLAILKELKIAYDVKTGILTTLFVDADFAGRACDALKIETETINGPSVN